MLIIMVMITNMIIMITIKHLIIREEDEDKQEWQYQQ